MQSDTSLNRFDQAVDWWPVECCPPPLQWLCEVAGDWRELEHAVVYVDPEHPKHAQLVTCLVSMRAMEELGHFQLPGIVYRSDMGCDMGLCIIMLKHEVMVADEWHNNGLRIS